MPGRVCPGQVSLRADTDRQPHITGRSASSESDCMSSHCGRKLEQLKKTQTVKRTGKLHTERSQPAS